MHSSRSPSRLLIPAGLVLAALASSATAVPSKAISEAAEFVARTFAREMGEETTETLAAKLTRLAEKHGDEAVDAFRKVGPRTFQLTEAAGRHADDAIRLMARRGPDAAFVLENPRRMTLFVRYGDDAAEAMLKHKGIAAPLIERYRAPAATMLRNLDPRNGRRLNMLMDEGFLTRTGKADELLAICGQYGDRAADFIWRNKGALLVGTALAAFLQDPDPFLDGTRDLASLTVAPVAQAAKDVAVESARRTNWTAVWLAIVGMAALLIVLRGRRRARERAARQG